MANENQRKRELLGLLLESGMVQITLDARCGGTDVPQHLRYDPQLRLNLSYRFGVPINLAVHGIEATLTFAGTPYDCTVPWPAIYAIFSSARPDESYLFVESVPPELATQLLEEAEDTDTERDNTAGSLALDNQDLRTSKSMLRLVEPPIAEPMPLRPSSMPDPATVPEPSVEDSASSFAPLASPEAAATSKRPPYLRVVK